MAKSYNEKNIKTLSFGAAVRTKLGMYLSSDKDEALVLGLRELIYNSQDEFEQGFGKKVTIAIDTKTGIISCTDNARGVPVGVREDGTNSLVAAFTLPHTGAKHDTDVYAGAVGVNGIGSKVVCHTSEFMVVTVAYKKRLYRVKFTETDEGAVTTGVEDLGKTTSSGTTVEYKPSKKVYEDAKLDIDKVRQTLQELSYFAKGLLFEFKVDGKTETFLSKNGLSDALSSENRIHKNILSHSETIEDVKVELALHWTKDGGEVKPYANNLHVREGGAFITGHRTSLTKAFNNMAGTDFSGEMIRKYLDGFVSVKVKVPQFSNQAKTSLANKEARTAAATATTNAIKDFFTKNPKDLTAILKVLANEKKAEDAAQRTREAINKIVTGAKTVNNLKDLPAKLADCSELGGELWLCEGE